MTFEQLRAIAVRVVEFIRGTAAGDAAIRQENIELKAEVARLSDALATALADDVADDEAIAAAKAEAETAKAELEAAKATLEGYEAGVAEEVAAIAALFEEVLPVEPTPEAPAE